MPSKSIRLMVWMTILLAVVAATAVAEPTLLTKELFHDNGQPYIRYTYYLSDGVEVLHGDYNTWDENGVMRWDHHYQDGLKAGRFLAFNGAGVQVQEDNYKADLRHGKSRFWTDNGKLQWEQTHSGGQFHGVQTYWSLYTEPPHISSQEYFANGVRTGAWPEFQPDGSKSWETVYENGMVAYETSWSYHPNGQVSGETIYEAVDGINHETYTSWHDNGQLENWSFYQNGMEAGVWLSWDANGNLIRQEDYELGERVTSQQWYWSSAGIPTFHSIETNENGVAMRMETSWFASGGMSAQETYLDYAGHGIWKYWYENGQISKEEEYDNDLETGEWMQWYDNGQLMWKGAYENYLKTGRWTWWDQWGNQTMEEHYDNGFKVSESSWGWQAPDSGSPAVTYHSQSELRDGQWYTLVSWYATDGQILARETSIDDLRQGEYTAWHSNGQMKQYGKYLDDAKEGPWKEWYDNGRLATRGDYHSGAKTGLHLYWDVDGFLYEERIFHSGFFKWKRYSFHFHEDAYHPLTNTGANFDAGYMCGTWNHQYYAELSAGVWEKYYWTTTNEPCPEIVAEEPPHTAPQPEKLEIRGHVTHARTGLPVPGAEITTGTGGSVQTTTDTRGFYAVTMDAAVNTPLVVEKTGYYTYSGTISTGAYQTTVHDIAMKAKAGPAPAITAVQSQYGGFFIHGIAVENTYTISVDWNGDPGHLLLELNGSSNQIDATGTTISTTVNMGSLNGSLSAKGNVIKVKAVNAAGATSEPVFRYPIVIPVPAWSQSLGTFGNIEYEDGAVAYNLEKAWPAEPLEIQINEKTLGSTWWAAWNLMPLVGGRPFGVPPTQANLAVEAKSDGSGSVTLTGATGFQAAGQDITSTVGGRGNLKYESGNGLMWMGADFLLGLEGTMKKEVGPVTLIPALEGAISLPLVGRVVKWFNELAVIDGSINAAANVDAQLVSETGDVGFHQAEGEVAAGVGIGLSADVSKASLSLSGGGSSKVAWQVPANPGYVKQIDAEVHGTLGIDLWLYADEFTGAHTFTYPEATGQSTTGRSVMAVDIGFKPISRDFTQNTVYSQFVDVPVRGVLSTSPFGSGETEMIQNVFPQSAPAVAATGTKRAIAFVYFDPADPTLQATEISVSYDDGTGFTAPAVITNDTRAEFAPALAFDAQGNLVCAWERVKATDFSSTDVTDMAAQMEIVYAVFDTSALTWSPPVPLTDNAILDHSPKIAAGSGGELLLMWKSNAAGHLVGTVAEQDTFHYRLWNSQTLAFDSAASSPGIANAITFAMAYDGTNAIVAYSVDLDGDLATTDDEELFTIAFDGSSWGAPARLTDNAVADINPQVLYRTDGTAELLWLMGTTLVRLDDWTSKTASPVRAQSRAITFADARALGDDQNRIILLWQALSGEDIDLFYAVFDPDHDIWSEDLRLTQDPAMEKTPAGVFTTGSTLNLVYAKENRETFQNDLYRLEHTLARDLALVAGTLAAVPANPAPGETVQLTVDVANTGDLAVTDIPVSFYLGDPDTGGPLINATSTGAAPLAAGHAVAVSVPWTVPADGSFTVVAVVDPNAETVERDEDNNRAAFIAVQTDLKAVRCTTDTLPTGDVIITADFINDGPIIAEDIEVAFFANGKELERITLPQLLPGKRAQVAHTVSGGGAFAGRENTAAFHIDPTQRVAETSTENNAAETILIINNFAAPDTLAFSQVPVDSTSPPLTLSLSNPDDSPYTIIDIALSDTDNFILDLNGGTSPVGSLPVTINPGEQKTINLIFTPTMEGAFSATVGVSLTDPAAPDAIIHVSGNGVAPLETGLVAAPASLAFGGVTAGGAPATTIITIANTGASDVAIAGVVLSDGTHFAVDTGAGIAPLQGTGGVIPAAGFSTLAVSFAPAAAVQYVTALVLNPVDAGIPAAGITLSGIGQPAPAAHLTASPRGLHFGATATTGTSAPLVVAISNAGSADAAITGLTLTGSGDFTIDVNGGNAPLGGTSGTISPGEMKTVAITFSPALPAPAEAVLTVQTATSPDATVSLTGFGTATGEADIDINPGALDYGTVQRNAAVTKRLTVSNFGEASLTVGNITISGPHAADFTIQSDGCSNQVMNAFDLCTLDIMVAAGTLGSRTAAATIFSDDSSTPSVSVPLAVDVARVVVPGDVDGNELVDITDAITALQLMIHPTGCPSAPCVDTVGDVNGDGMIGLVEAIYILQTLSQYR